MFERVMAICHCRVVIGLCLVVPYWVPQASGAVAFFRDQAAFELLHPDMRIENFSGVRTLNTNFNGPLVESSNTFGPSGEEIYRAGEIMPGVAFTALNDPIFGLRTTLVNGNTVLTAPSTLGRLAVNFPADPVMAARLDLFQFNQPGNVSVDVFGSEGLLGTTQVFSDTVNGSFLGMTADVPIRQIIVNDSSIVPAIDNVGFEVPNAFFTVDKNRFAALTSGLVTEDFHKARLVDTNFTGPVDSVTKNVSSGGQTILLPGEIVPGISFNSDGDPNFGFRFKMIGSDKVLTTPSINVTVRADFTRDDVTAVSLNTYQFNRAGDVRVQVIGLDNRSLGFVQMPANSLQGTFVGIVSPFAPIKRLLISDSDITPGVHNISFGSASDNLGLFADLNSDGAVDAADAGIMFANWGTAGNGDISRDRIVDAFDAGILFSAWTGDTAVRTVPEPIHLGVMAIMASLTWSTFTRRASSRLKLSL